ncbi:MAG TPA: hypothetical protein PKJ77_09380 [Thermodesulfobacteriota bacterium]|nr:hypothetical protein [Thermodesulfobacteriota bacterium]
MTKICHHIPKTAVDLIEKKHRGGFIANFSQNISHHEVGISIAYEEGNDRH